MGKDKYLLSTVVVHPCRFDQTISILVSGHAVVSPSPCQCDKILGIRRGN
jgi:hypothetical protein